MRHRIDSPVLDIVSPSGRPPTRHPSSSHRQFMTALWVHSFNFAHLICLVYCIKFFFFHLINAAHSTISFLFLLSFCSLDLLFPSALLPMCLSIQLHSTAYLFVAVENLSTSVALMLPLKSCLNIVDHQWPEFNGNYYRWMYTVRVLFAMSFIGPFQRWWSVVD